MERGGAQQMAHIFTVDEDGSLPIHELINDFLNEHPSWDEAGAIVYDCGDGVEKVYIRPALGRAFLAWAYERGDISAALYTHTEAYIAEAEGGNPLSHAWGA